jgi:hypothetical protein
MLYSQYVDQGSLLIDGGTIRSRGAQRILQPLAIMSLPPNGYVGHQAKWGSTPIGAPLAGEFDPADKSPTCARAIGSTYVAAPPSIHC